MPSETTTIDAGEIAKFQAMADTWWDPDGMFKPLHMLNPCRLDYITAQIAGEFGRSLTADRPFHELRILDIGCGGGLLSEPMARLGARVTGADAAARNIPVAQLHAEASGLDIDYRHTTAEALAEAGEVFDVVLNMEVVEHVSDPRGLSARLPRPPAPRRADGLLDAQSQSQELCDGDPRRRMGDALAAQGHP